MIILFLSVDTIINYSLSCVKNGYEESWVDEACSKIKDLNFLSGINQTYHPNSL